MAPFCAIATMIERLYCIGDIKLERLSVVGEDADGAMEDAVHIGDGEAVVGDRDMSLDGGLEA